MKKTFLAILAFGLTFAVDAQVQTPAASPASTVKQTVGLTTFEINYSRPSLRGRELYNELVPINKPWRFGANQNTTISFDTEIIIEGNKVKEGQYAIFAIPNKNEWTFILYNETSNWGVPKEIEDKKIVAKFDVGVRESEQFTESFTIAFTDVSDFNSVLLDVAWGKVLLPIKIELPTHDLTLKSIEKAMSKKPTHSDYFRSGMYYLGGDLDANQAVKYLSEAVNTNKEAPAYYYYNLALAQEKAGSKDEALKTAELTLKVAKESKSESYANKSAELIERLQN